MIEKLNFTRGNAKLKRDTAILSLPAGHTCPAALLCKSKADRLTGQITDGPKCQFRCYATAAESMFKNIRESRWRNFELLKSRSLGEMVDLIELSIPQKGIKLVRIHQSGDFFSQTYFDAWVQVSVNNAGLIHYGYTKALPFWIKRKDIIPANLKLVASMGGLHDALIVPNNLRYARVVFSEKEAEDLRLEIDHDDTHAWKHEGNFAILIHGCQPKGSLAGVAWQILKRRGQGGYKADYFKKKHELIDIRH